MLTGDRANRRNSTRPKTIWLRATRASASISSLSTKHWEMGGNHFLNRERRRYEFVWTNATDREHSYCTQEHNCDRRRYPGRRIRLPSFARESFRSRNARPHRLAVASGPPACDNRPSSLEGFNFGELIKQSEEKQPRSKSEIVALLCAEGERWCDWLATFPETVLAEQVRMPGGGSKTRFEMLLGTKEHEMHHRAQLMVIERLLGIVPHLTRNRQPARTA